MLSDTVGFIRDLPPTLIAAFRATLEETVHADLLLHVVGRRPARSGMSRFWKCNKVLTEIGAARYPRHHGIQQDRSGWDWNRGWNAMPMVRLREYLSAPPSAPVWMRCAGQLRRPDRLRETMPRIIQTLQSE